MSWQLGSGRTDPKASNVAAGHRPASMRGRLSSFLNPAILAPVRQRLSRYELPQFGGPVVRRIAIGVVSCLLLLGAFFQPGTERVPALARGLASDSPDSPPLSGWVAPTAALGDAEQSGSLLGASVPTVKPLLPSLLKQMDTPTPAPSATPTPKPEPLPEWVQSSRATALWSGSGEKAEELARVPEKSYLRVLGREENDRLLVYFEKDEASGSKVGGWIARADVQPSGEPTAEADVQPSGETPRVVASSRGSRPTPDISTPEKFIAAVGEAARESQRDSGVPASVTIAQAILESDWGRSLLATKGQNYFGIKASSGPGPAGVISMNTWEVLGGRDVVVRDGFKAYNNMLESIMDHGRFLKDNSRYARAFNYPDKPNEFARQIHLAGYATDPAYTSKLVNIMTKYNLYQYDLGQPQG